MTDERRSKLNQASPAAMLKTLLAGMPDYLYFKDAERRFVVASEAFCDHLGRSMDAIVGKTDEELFPPHVARETARDDLEVIRTGTPIISKEEGDDSIGWVLTTKMPWRDEAGDIIGLFGISRDITARKRSEAALRESEERFRRLVENNPTVVWATDSSGATTYISPNVESVYGYAADQVLAAGEELWIGRIHPDDRKRVQDAFSELFREAKTFDVRYRIQRKDGEWIWLHDRANAVAEQEGQLLAYGVFTDISAQMRAEAERRALEGQLRSSQKLESLGVLASGLAHDFNNLLVGVQGNLDLAELRTEEGAACRPFLKDARLAARRVADLTSQMLAYAGKGKVSAEDVELNDTVRELASLLTASLSKKAELRFDLSREPLVTRADPTQIRQVVMNLITNAAQSLGDEPGAVTIRTARVERGRTLLDMFPLAADLRAGAYVCLEVSDTGEGMDEITRERIFDPFFTTKRTGHGLGLSAVLGIVKDHAGAIKVESELGQGTSFTLLLPLSSPTAPAAEAPPRPRVGGLSGTILVVDDDHPVREVAEESLDVLGFVVLSAADGVEALEVLRARGDEIDCVLLDLKMPRMDGLEAYEEIRRIRSELPVILCSGFARDAARELTGKGLAGALQKPYSLAELEQVLRVALGRSGKGA